MVDILIFFDRYESVVTKNIIDRVGFLIWFWCLFDV